jgi:hypothetical protein
MQPARLSRFLPWLALAWPAVVAALALTYPGPDAQAELRSLYAFQTDLSGPPVDTQGAAEDAGEPGEAGQASTGGAKVFWSTPQPGEVNLRIEIPPADEAAPELQTNPPTR